MSLFNDIDLNHAICGGFFEPKNRLIDYFLTSNGNHFKKDIFLKLMLKRKNWAELTKIERSLGYTVTERSILAVRANLLANNDRAFTIATKINPTCKELEEFSELKTRWSILFPVKAYLCDHPEVAINYKGMQPFGGPVISFFNAIIKKWNTDWKVSGAPTYQDHEHLRTLTNHHSILKGVPTIEINTQMYQEGCKEEYLEDT